MKHIAYIIILVLAVLLRLPDKGIWIDEVHYYQYLEAYNEDLVGGIIQTGGTEFLPVMISYILGFDSIEQGMWLSFYFGVLMIIIIPMIFKDEKIWIPLMIIMTISPILWYWSQFARPYVIGAFFVVLAWRYPPFILLGVLCNPIAICGVNLTKKKWWLFYLVVIIGAVLFYKYQPLVGWSYRQHFSTDFLLTARRLYVIPYTVLLLYISSIPNDWLERLQLYAKRLVGNT